MKRLNLLLILFLSVAPLRAAENISYEQDGARKAAVRVRNWINGYQQGALYSGTGTLTAIDGDSGLVLTAGHIFEGKVGPITVEFSDGQISGATLGAVDHKLDVAMLWVYAPKDIEPLPLDQANPDLGDEVEIWGYGPARFRSFLAKVSQPIAVVGEEAEALVGAQGVENKQVTIPGDSGGPMVRSGRLVAVHWGYRGHDTDPRRCVHAVGCGRLRTWLKSNLAEPVAHRLLGL